MTSKRNEHLTNKAINVSRRICEIEYRLACRDLTVHEAEDLRYEKAELEEWDEVLSAYIKARRDCDELQQSVKELEQREQELAATVGRLREYLGSLIDESTGVVGWHLNGAVADWDEIGATDILEETPQQSLNALKREVAIPAYMKGYIDATEICEFGCDGASTEQELLVESLPHAEMYANTEYPSDKDGE